MTLRSYQQDCFDSIMEWVLHRVEPCVIEAATGAGKSHIIAAVAQEVSKISGKKILCLSPSQELLTQNRDKYLMTGNPSSVFSASAGRKCLKHDVVFATPLSVKNNVSKFKGFAMIIIDEAHEITPTIKSIIKEVKKDSPNIRVVGLTGTPYRTKEGYIYKFDEEDKNVNEEAFFHKLIYRITADHLLEMGFLTPIKVGEEIDSYDTKDVYTERFSKSSIDRAFVGKGRKTSNIIKDVINMSTGKTGVMIFAANIDHANEILTSLPPELSVLVTGSLKKNDREIAIKSFKNKSIKYIVNVDVLTTGFDAPHVDVIAILRATESPGLLQQIVGRGLRLAENKTHCVILDYANNIKRHCPDGDIFNPSIKQIKTGNGPKMKIPCPTCSYTNEFSARKNDCGFTIDDEGYFCDLTGHRIELDKTLYPAHFGRRCFGYTELEGDLQRCAHRWESRQCPECEHHNDITAKKCEQCKHELIDPNAKLMEKFARMASPHSITTENVLSYVLVKTLSTKGSPMIRIKFKTESKIFDAFFMPKIRASWRVLCKGVGSRYNTVNDFQDLQSIIKQITYKKDKSSGFYKVYDLS